jgi:hypothetical protein
MPRPVRTPQHPDDLVILIDSSGAYVIVTIDGQRIGTSHSRRDAMRLACAAAADTGATVWLCIDASSQSYHEVVCP